MRILLVEDDARLTAVLRKGLEEHGDAVDVSHDGEDGLALAIAGDYDAVVLDVMLPRKSGFEIVDELRRRHQTTPVLMLTARSTVEDRVRGLDLGADDYLAKPFDFRELLARLRALSRRPAVEPVSVLREADLELDPVRHEVRRAGRRVELAMKEFALLELFLKRKGTVLTRSMILDHVWALDYDGDTNLVEVYVNYIRKKIDRDFEPKLLHTVRGVGYVLEDRS